jgi:hypothetical protein
MAADPLEALDAPDTLEALASVEHERWSHWQRYLHSRCITNDDGSLTIPANLVARWTRQAMTDFTDLDEDEKESDREQAREYISALQQLLAR